MERHTTREGPNEDVRRYAGLKPRRQREQIPLAQSGDMTRKRHGSGRANEPNASAPEARCPVNWVGGQASKTLRLLCVRMGCCPLAATRVAMLFEPAARHQSFVCLTRVLLRRRPSKTTAHPTTTTTTTGELLCGPVRERV